MGCYVRLADGVPDSFHQGYISCTQEEGITYS